MSAFDPRTVAQWLRGQRAASERSLSVLPPREAIRLSLSLIEAAWPLAGNDLNRRLHEESARPARETWRRIAQLTGRLPTKASSSRRSPP